MQPLHSYRHTDRPKLTWLYNERGKEGILLYLAIFCLQNFDIVDDSSFKREFRKACTGFLLKLDAVSPTYGNLLKSARLFFQKLVDTEAVDDLVDLEKLSSKMRLQVEDCLRD